MPKVVRASPELEAELRTAIAEIERGEYIELTVEQLDHAAATGELPWEKSALHSFDRWVSQLLARARR